MTQKWRWRNDGISLSKLSACGAARYEGKGPSFALSADRAISLEEVRDCDGDAQDVRLLHPTAGGWHSLLRLFVEFCRVLCVLCVLCVLRVVCLLCLLLPLSMLRNTTFETKKRFIRM